VTSFQVGQPGHRRRHLALHQGELAQGVLPAAGHAHLVVGAQLQRLVGMQLAGLGLAGAGLEPGQTGQRHGQLGGVTQLAASAMASP
jgi:hypothetical protein